MGFGRNNPCPCGSGKKYKKCCMIKSTTEQTTALPKGKFTYDPGSYGGPGRGYFPSLMCKKLTPFNTWENYYCLVKANSYFDQEDDAIMEAKDDLENAKSSADNPVEFAQNLREKGYDKLDDFKLAIEK
jgi:hypothetical protein